MSKLYTGRKVAIFTDAHGLLERVEAALADIKKKGITEIYSLGDNIGDGPDSLGVVITMQEYGVKSIAGNAEEYIRLGIEPFASYMNNPERIAKVEKIKKNLSNEGIELIHKMSHSFEIIIGGKKVGLCHFGNDVRIDFNERSTFSYQKHFDTTFSGKRLNDKASKQFSYTSSWRQIRKIKKLGTGNARLLKSNLGFASVYDEPMFPSENNPHIGKKLKVFNDIFQGHVHFKLFDPGKTNFHSIRAVGMAYRENPINTASYIILEEYIDHNTGEKGFDIQEILVEYDREKTIFKILNETDNSDVLEKYTSVTDIERTRLKKG